MPNISQAGLLGDQHGKALEDQSGKCAVMLLGQYTEADWVELRRHVARKIAFEKLPKSEQFPKFVLEIVPILGEELSSATVTEISESVQAIALRKEKDKRDVAAFLGSLG